MKTQYTFPKNLQQQPPGILTIGTFDGVHLGHQTHLKHVVDDAEKSKKPSIVISFDNHPSTVLTPSNPTPLICTTEHRIALLDKAKIDLLILLTFTKEISEQSPEEFLHNLQSAIPFHKLILGTDSHIGKGREGDRFLIESLGKKIGFQTEFFSKYANIGKERVSSSAIRKYITEGNLTEAAKFLGRPFSIYSKVIKGAGRGAAMGFPTINIGVEGLCLPPLGVYAVSLIHQGKTYAGVANLGIAPTVREKAPPLLEIFLIDQNINLYDEFVEIVFLEYIRKEKRFENLEQLQMQIKQDVKTAQNIHVLYNKTINQT